MDSTFLGALGLGALLGTLITNLISILRDRYQREFQIADRLFLSRKQVYGGLLGTLNIPIPEDRAEIGKVKCEIYNAKLLASQPLNDLLEEHWNDIWKIFSHKTGIQRYTNIQEIVDRDILRSKEIERLMKLELGIK